MQVAVFLDNLKAKNIRLSVENGKVKVRGERKLLNPFLAEIKARKAEIIEHFTESKNDKSAIIDNPKMAITPSKTKSETTKELTWFDLCGNCQSELYESWGQWFCPTNCR